MIETSRCLLSKMENSDGGDIKKLYVNKEVRAYLGGTRDEVSIDTILDDMLNANEDTWYWMIREKHSNEFIGLISLDPHHTGKDIEVSYQFLPQWWGSGYATEVVGEIITFAFSNLGLPRVVAETQIANSRSRRLLERLDMQLINTFYRYGAEQALYSIDADK